MLQILQEKVNKEPSNELYGNMMTNLEARAAPSWCPMAHGPTTRRGVRLLDMPFGVISRQFNVCRHLGDAFTPATLHQAVIGPEPVAIEACRLIEALARRRPSNCPNLQGDVLTRIFSFRERPVVRFAALAALTWIARCPYAKR